MPTIRTKHGLRIVDPGGDPATAPQYGTNPGGFIEVNGVVESTQAAGWRQRLINRGAATSSA